MGNDQFNPLGGELKNPKGFAYIEQIKHLRNKNKKKEFRTGGNGYGKWGVEVIQKLKRSRRTISFRVLGVTGDYFNAFFKPLLKDVKKFTEDDIKVFVHKGMILKDAMKLFKEYKDKQLGGKGKNEEKDRKREFGRIDKEEEEEEKMEIKLVVKSSISSDCIKFQKQLEKVNIMDTSTLITESATLKLGFILGPLFFEWEEDGLIVPKLFKPNPNFLSILDLKTDLKMNTANLLKLAETCCYFNKYFKFTPFLASEKSNHACSHDFVYLALKETLQMQEKFKPKGPIDMYLKNLLSADDILLSFKGFTYTTDQQIDAFMKHHKDDKDLDTQDYIDLLKSFQRVLDIKIQFQKEREARNARNPDTSGLISVLLQQTQQF